MTPALAVDILREAAPGARVADDPALLEAWYRALARVAERDRSRIERIRAARDGRAAALADEVRAEVIADLPAHAPREITPAVVATIDPARSLDPDLLLTRAVPERVLTEIRSAWGETSADPAPELPPTTRDEYPSLVAAIVDAVSEGPPRAVSEGGAGPGLWWWTSALGWRGLALALLGWLWGWHTLVGPIAGGITLAVLIPRMKGDPAGQAVAMFILVHWAFVVVATPFAIAALALGRRVRWLVPLLVPFAALVPLLTLDFTSVGVLVTLGALAMALWVADRLLL